MKFNKSLDWLKEADEENLLGDDELDSVKPDINEADKETYTDDNGVERYVGNHKAVDKTATSEPQKKQEPAKKQEPQKVKAGKKVSPRDIKQGQSYVSKDDVYYGDLEDVAWEEDQQQRLRELGFVNKDNEVIFPAGTEFKYKGFAGGAEVFDISGEEFDLSLDDVEFYEAEKEEPAKQEPKNLYTSFRDDLDKLMDSNPEWSNSKLIKEVAKKYADQYKNDPDKLTNVAKYFKRLLSGN